MAENNAVVRVYDSHAEVGATIKELQSSGFDMNKLSIVGKDYHTEDAVIGYYNAGDRMTIWCQLGNFWGGLSGLLFGSAFFLILRIGPLIVFSPLVSSILCSMERAVMVVGLRSLVAGLHLIGI